MNNTRLVRSVPIPNLLFDEFLPTLAGTELKILLVVLRSTLGWQETDGAGNLQFKHRDWINHTQLMKRTGRGSAAVSAGVQSLVLRSLIIVENWRGEPLDTPELRRSNIGKVFYRPGDMWITARPSVIAKVSTTTYSYNKIHRAADVDNFRAEAIRSEQPRPSGFQRVGTILDTRAAPDV